MWIVAPGYSPSAPGSEGSISASSWPFPALERSVSWRGSLSPAKSWLTRWRRGGWIKRLCGRICKPSTAQRGVDAWISSLRDTHASRSPLQGSARARKTRATCGPKSLESLGKYDRATSSWRTSQDTFGWDLSESSVILPNSGSMRSGLLYERPMLEPRTEGRDSSCWPTAPVCGNHNRTGASATSGDGLSTAAKEWPTPISRDWKGSPGVNRTQRSLPRDAVQWATPTTRDWKGGADPSPNAPTNGLLGRQAPRATGPQSPHGCTRRLNPAFVEWLMGIPLGWTALEPLATPSSPPKRPMPSQG